MRNVNTALKDNKVGISALFDFNEETEKITK